MSVFIRVFSNVFESSMQRMRALTKGGILRENGGFILRENGGIILRQ